jgi:DNA-binding beta-propeller fold protein YncE
MGIDSSDNIYVADTNNNRIQKFDPDGKFLLKFGSGGYRAGEFSGPSGIAVDSSGNVYVTDTYNHRVQKFKLAP